MAAPAPLFFVARHPADLLQKELMLRVLGILLAAGGLLAAGEIHRSINFEQGDLSAWSLPRAADWEIASEGGNHFLRLLHAGEIGAPRRPLQYALLKDACVGDFTLRVKVSRAGNSMMIAFGYQDTLHFYYAHLSADDGNHRVHNGLFKVDGGERFRIAGTGSRPVLPDQKWHEVRIVRHVDTGKMEVFAGNDLQPRFEYTDSAFRFGRVGLGSFDETGDFDDFRLDGQSSSQCH
jgi:hypothetical protein